MSRNSLQFEQLVYIHAMRKSWGNNLETLENLESQNGLQIQFW